MLVMMATPTHPPTHPPPHDQAKRKHGKKVTLFTAGQHAREFAREWFEVDGDAPADSQTAAVYNSFEDACMPRTLQAEIDMCNGAIDGSDGSDGDGGGSSNGNGGGGGGSSKGGGSKGVSKGGGSKGGSKGGAAAGSSKGGGSKGVSKGGGSKGGAAAASSKGGGSKGGSKGGGSAGATTAFARKSCADLVLCIDPLMHPECVFSLSKLTIEQAKAGKQQVAVATKASYYASSDRAMTALLNILGLCGPQPASFYSDTYMQKADALKACTEFRRRKGKARWAAYPLKYTTTPTTVGCQRNQCRSPFTVAHGPHLVARGPTN